MQYQVLFTVFAMLASCIATWMAWSAREHARRAEHSEHRLAIMRGQVRGFEVSLAALDESHRKLAGKVHADTYWRGKRDEQPELQPIELGVGGTLTVCDNYRRSQLEGPTSPAAQCACAYCEQQRADRAARRAKLRTGVKS